ncbi:ABC transporter substrate-binding protein [Amycolatopsis sp. GM8]|uniref:ABC transporter substrate-binding protein n=1 Tax=Amycolatopsis sp. GM8 TaxID=2896530 RepID=UPI001F394799|nr:hypothetical protein [Amycolatopsis sp. GM8]
MKRRAPFSVAMAVMLVLLSACSPSIRVRELTLPAGLAPEPGIDIPQLTISAGWSPIGDGLIPLIGERRGYFRDAGIEFTRTNGYKSNLLTSMTPMLNGQIEIGDTYMPLLTPQMSTVQSVTTFALPTTAHVQRILAPKGKYKTLSGLMAQGIPFRQAAQEVMAQLKGKTMLLYTGVDPQFYNVALGLAGLTLGDVKTQYMGDPDMVTAALSGQGDFASPNGAVQVSQLQSAGWEPLMIVSDVITNLPSETLNMANTYTGFVTTKNFASENYNAILRFTGVLFRIIHDLDADPVGACASYVDYINSYTGSHLTAEDCSHLYTDGIYELNTFENYQAVAGPTPPNPPPNHATDYPTQTNAQIQRLQAQAVLPGGHYSASDISFADRVYHDLRTYRDQARALLATAPPGQLHSQAQKFYDDYDYLDAYRYALAATKG